VKLAHPRCSRIWQDDERRPNCARWLDGERDREIQLAIAQIYEKGEAVHRHGKGARCRGEAFESKADKQQVLFMRGAIGEAPNGSRPAESEFRKVLDMDRKRGRAELSGYMLADRNVRLE